MANLYMTAINPTLAIDTLRKATGDGQARRGLPG